MLWIAADETDYHRVFLASLKAVDAAKLEACELLFEHLRQKRELSVVGCHYGDIFWLYTGGDEIADVQSDDRSFVLVDFAFGE